MSQAMMNQTTCSQTANHATSHHPAAAVASLPGRLFSSAVRGGFTVIEILVVIVIIGILVGLLVPGVMSATRRAREFAIEQEIAQLTSSLETFKAKYGFYPPDFTRISSINDFLPYLNRIAPNHGHTQAQLLDWWNMVGRKLRYAGPQSSYVFWLSGLAKNKQYPLTTTAGIPLEAFNSGTVEREVFFDFENARLYSPFNPSLLKTTPVSHPAGLIGNIAPGPDRMIATYSQFTGACQPFVYFEVKSIPSGWTWDLGPGTSPNGVNTSTPDGANLVLMFPYIGSNGRYFNSESFQLIAPGLDSRFSAAPANSPDIGSCNPRERDNLTNFSQGRLENSIIQ